MPHIFDFAERVPDANSEISRLPHGVLIRKPWQALNFGRLVIPPGTYTFETDARTSAVTLQLRSKGYNLVELTATAGTPAYMTLSDEIYEASLIFGGRTGIYEVSRFRLKHVGRIALAARLARRAWSSLVAGTLLRDIRAARAVLSGKSGNVGFRTQAGPPSPAGLHAQLDLQYPSRATTDDTGIAANVGLHIEDIFGRDVPASYVAGQSDSCFYLVPAAAADYRLVVDIDEVLTADALRQLSSALDLSAPPAVILADKWINGTATANVAWDPVYYSASYPTPYLVKTSLPALTGVRQADTQAIAVPIAHAADIDRRAFAAPATVLPDDDHACSVIIPTRDRADLLEGCLAGLFEQTSWPHEVIVIDNGSTERSLFELLERYQGKGIKVIRDDRPFNFSALCNLGAKAARHPYLLFLNNDIVLTQPNWLREMMQFAAQAETGAVGCRLLYPDGSLQHGGVAIGVTEACGHLWRGLPNAEIDRQPRLGRSSLRAAVTAACLCVNANKFQAVGGFDESDFPVTLNDIDLCLKLTEAGWYSVYCATAEALHLEGTSRGQDDGEKRARRERELNAFAAKWRSYLDHDPWLSPAISRIGEKGQLR